MGVSVTKYRCPLHSSGPLLSPSFLLLVLEIFHFRIRIIPVVCSFVLQESTIVWRSRAEEIGVFFQSYYFIHKFSFFLVDHE